MQSSPFGGSTPLGTSSTEPVSGDAQNQSSAFLAQDRDEAVPSVSVESKVSRPKPRATVTKPSVIATQTEQVVMVDIDSLYGPREPEDVEELGRDLVRLVRQYCSQHPSALGQLAGHNPVPEYAFNHEPYAIPAPRSDWPEPPLPPGVDWESNDHGVLAYMEKVMVFHLVNAAHSIVRLHDPSLHSDPQGDPVKLDRLRDISIGIRDNNSSRIIEECMGPPGNVHVSEGYHPRCRLG